MSKPELDILKHIKEWAVLVRKQYSEKKQQLATDKPTDKQVLAVLGGKIKAFQQVIDKIRQLETEAQSIVPTTKSKEGEEK